jgi:hypothetical protein
MASAAAAIPNDKKVIDSSPEKAMAIYIRLEKINDLTADINSPQFQDAMRHTAAKVNELLKNTNFLSHLKERQSTAKFLN